MLVQVCWLYPPRVGLLISPHFSIFVEFCNRRWTADVSCIRATQPLWPACWVDIPDRSLSSSSKAVQDIWDIPTEELVWFLPILSLLLGLPSIVTV